MADPVAKDKEAPGGISNAGPPIDTPDETPPPPASNTGAAANTNTPRRPDPKDTRVLPLAPSHDDADNSQAAPNPTVEALKQVLTLKNLDPHMEEMLRTARLRPTKDGQALLIDLPDNGHCLHCGKTRDGIEFIGMPTKKMVADEHDAHIMVGLAKGRGWKSVNVTGSDKEKELIWLEAMRQGLTVANFMPDPNSAVAKTWEKELMEAPQPILTEAKPEDFHVKTMQMLQEKAGLATDPDVKTALGGTLKKFTDGAILGNAEIFKSVSEALGDKPDRDGFNKAADVLNKTDPKLGLAKLDPPAADPKPAAANAVPKPVTPG